MPNNNSQKYMHTNINIFYQIVKESLNLMNESLEKHIRAKPGNEPGHIKTYDPNSTSFKQALIAILFSSACLESLLHHLIVTHKGVEESKRIDRYTYKSKLKALGCDDEDILELSERLRCARKDIVHEKAYLFDGQIRLAEGEARYAVSLLDKVLKYFGLKFD